MKIIAEGGGSDLMILEKSGFFIEIWNDVRNHHVNRIDVKKRPVSIITEFNVFSDIQFSDGRRKEISA